MTRGSKDLPLGEGKSWVREPVPKSYTTTIRLPIELYEELELVAKAEDKPVSEVIREAIAAHIEARRGDAEFQARLKERIKKDQAILKKLAAS